MAVANLIHRNGFTIRSQLTANGKKAGDPML
jgi:hypothetical protein